MSDEARRFARQYMASPHNFVEPDENGVTDLRPYALSPEEWERNRAEIFADQRPPALSGGGWEHVHPTDHRDFAPKRHTGIV